MGLYGFYPVKKVWDICISGVMEFVIIPSSTLKLG
jgi:hypothetical protein